MATITKKHITFNLEYKGTEYIVYIPFVKYEMFKDIYLIFNYMYDLINQGVNPYTFCQDIEAYIELAINIKYKGIDSKEKLKAVDNFFNQSLLGAYVLDTKNNYELIMLDKFLNDDDESETFLTELKGLYTLFYSAQRYVNVEKVEAFKDFYTSLSVMELKKSFMKSIYKETFTKENIKAINLSQI